MTNDPLANYALHLEKSLSPNVTDRKAAENFLHKASSSITHINDLLLVSMNQNYPLPVKLAAAINLKNFIKKFWKVEIDHDNLIPDQNRDQFKAHLIDAMLHSSGNIQKQISECVSIIGKSDFPEKWPDILPDLIKRMSQYGGNITMANGVLQIADSLFSRYRHEASSDVLFKEIIMVISQFAAPLTELAKNLCTSLENTSGMTSSNISELLTALSLVLDIFYSLNCQDLPEFFEDNLQDWMTIHKSLLNISPSIIKDLAGSDKSPVEMIKSQICSNIILYTTKYEEEFSPFLSSFVTDVWTLLTDSNNMSHDLLAGNLIEFISSVVAKPQHRSIFQSAEALQKLCEAVILPNIQFRINDEECFEDTPEEYITQDLEDTDTSTRRKSACTLVFNLCEAFGPAVMDNFSGYINHLLDQYEKGKIAGSNDNANWKQKDAALMLVTSVCAMGKTGKLGVTVTSNLVDIQQFFDTYVLTELALDNEMLPVIKADCLKYAIEFRSKLSLNSLKQALSYLPNMMKSKHYVVQSYACILLEKVLSLPHPNDSTSSLISIGDIPNPVTLLENIFYILAQSQSVESVHAIKALVRLMTFLQNDLIPFIAGIVEQLSKKLILVSKNPNKPIFNHFLFESIAYSVVVTCNHDPTAIENFEMAFTPILQEILNQDVTEFFPYIFQLYALFLEQYPFSPVIKTNIPTDLDVFVRKTSKDMKPNSGYLSLLNQILVPSLWSQNALIPSMTRLLRAFLLHLIEEVFQFEKFESILGVYQRLVKSKSFDQYAFSILQAVVLALPQQQLFKYLKDLFVCLFDRLTSNKTDKFMRGFANFIGQFCFQSDPNSLIMIVDSINPSLFGRLLLKVIIPNATYAIVQKQVPVVSCESNWYSTSIGLTRLLFQAKDMNAFHHGKYKEFFYPLLIATIEGICAGPSRGGDDCVARTVDLLSKPNYKIIKTKLQLFEPERASSSFNLQLALENNPEPFVQTYDSRVYLGKFLSESCSSFPGLLSSMVDPKDEKSTTILQNYATQMKITLQ